MKNRMGILLLVLCLLLSAFPVHAAPETEAGQVCQDMIDDYRDILKNTNMASLQGYCGLMASWQLYFLGVNDWVMSHHGKDQYDAYYDAAVTSGGHSVKAYSAANYTLEEALNQVSRNGTRNVYNILVGFQKTSTALGSIYGHSLVIYAILDGIIYYTEGYNTPFGYAGNPFCVTIEEFVDYYDDWTQFEGVIVFGKKGYVANCTEYGTNLFGEITAAAELYTQPCKPGTRDAQSEYIRTVNPGERIWVNALFENPDGEFYYQVSDSGLAGYVQVQFVEPVRFNYEDIGISNVQNPADVEEGKKITVTGRISSEYSTMNAIHMEVTDSRGNLIMSHSLAKQSGVYDLESDTFSKIVSFSSLPEGNYISHIYADGLNYYIQDGALREDTRQLHLVASPFRVGNVETVPFVPEEPEETVKDGWVWENRTWYYYEQGVPRAGWFCYHGSDYYLKSDGSVTTGWVQINGKYRYFSRTGSMRTGWIETEAGKLYLMSNGAPAIGERVIDGVRYRFDENGILI